MMKKLNKVMESIESILKFFKKKYNSYNINNLKIKLKKQLLVIKGGENCNKNNENTLIINNSKNIGSNNNPAGVSSTPPDSNFNFFEEPYLEPKSMPIKINNKNIATMFIESIKKKILIKYMVLKEFAIYCIQAVIQIFYWIYNNFLKFMSKIFSPLKSTWIWKFIISSKIYKIILYYFLLIKEFLIRLIKKYYLEILIFIGICTVSYNLFYFWTFFERKKLMVEKQFNTYFNISPIPVLVRATEDIRTIVRNIEADFFYLAEKKTNTKLADYELYFEDLSTGEGAGSGVKRSKNLRITHIAQYIIEQISINLTQLDQLFVNLNSQNVAMSEGYSGHKIMLRVLHRCIIDFMKNTKKYLGVYFRMYKVVNRQPDTAKVIAALHEEVRALKGASMDQKINLIARLIAYGRIVHVYAQKTAYLINIMNDRIATYRKYKTMVSKMIKIQNVENVSILTLLISKIITKFYFLYFKFMEYKIEYLHSFKELDLFKNLNITKDDFYIRIGILKFLKKALTSGDSNTLGTLSEISAVQISTPKV